MRDDNPYAPPVAKAVNYDQVLDNSPYPGIGRLVFVVLAIAIFGASVALHSMISSQGDFDNIPGILCAAGLVAIAVYRYRNLGTSGWHSLLLLIPVVSIGVMFYLAVYPAGYSRHKQFDTAGKAAVMIIALLFISILAAIILSH